MSPPLSRNELHMSRISYLGLSRARVQGLLCAVFSGQMLYRHDKCSTNNRSVKVSQSHKISSIVLSSNVN